MKFYLSFVISNTICMPVIRELRIVLFCRTLTNSRRNSIKMRPEILYLFYPPLKQCAYFIHKNNCSARVSSLNSLEDLRSLFTIH